MKAPREGSRKAAVYDVFHKDGLAAAIKHAVGLGLKEGTVKSWAGGWDGKEHVAHAPDNRKGPKAPKAAAEGGTETRASVAGVFSPHFKHASRAAAERHMLAIVRRAGTHDSAFHIIEADDRFAVVPITYMPKGPPPQFEEGDIVFDTTIPNKRGKVVTAGPEVCDVKYEEGVRAIPNYYLHKFDGPTPDDKPKKKRVKVVEPEVAAKPVAKKKPAKPIKKGKK